MTGALRDSGMRGLGVGEARNLGIAAHGREIDMQR